MFNRISHVGVVVNDIEEALRIWRDKLGFKQFSEAHFDVEGIRRPESTSFVSPSP